MRQIRHGEEDRVARVWGEGFPELEGGTFREVLDPSKYEKYFGGPARMFVVELTEDERPITAVWLLTMDIANLSVDFTLVTVHPSFRQRGILKLSATMLDRYVKSCGAELATVKVAMFHSITYSVFRDLGFTLSGITPGAIRASDGNGMYRRDSVGDMYKLYPSAGLSVPPIGPEWRKRLQADVVNTSDIGVPTRVLRPYESE